jgi:hypothetical protein
VIAGYPGDWQDMGLWPYWLDHGYDPASHGHWKIQAKLAADGAIVYRGKKLSDDEDPNEHAYDPVYIAILHWL